MAKKPVEDKSIHNPIADDAVSAIVKVRCFSGSDNLGYYVTVYANGKIGSRSEGYGSKNNKPEANLVAAQIAAARDYPTVDVEVAHDLHEDADES